eukprot:gnl/TRDRNA2_/TRDRNA2_83788_c1_seq1.p1 gnl/TRDRNA2_/TRDRNA2_83788_c1~~gnl/TRDRNA2_/TRDRNA2_83788_c1_seq1.p1  ORF type:complete len:249 (+),score=40.56 gnl/TRDRNA2_/TRDRNA2_83788_c1_seq1:42-749(+)
MQGVIANDNVAAMSTSIFQVAEDLHAGSNSSVQALQSQRSTLEQLVPPLLSRFEKHLLSLAVFYPDGTEQLRRSRIRELQFMVVCIVLMCAIAAMCVYMGITAGISRKEAAPSSSPDVGDATAAPVLAPIPMPSPRPMSSPRIGWVATPLVAVSPRADLVQRAPLAAMGSALKAAATGSAPAGRDGGASTACISSCPPRTSPTALPTKSHIDPSSPRSQDSSDPEPEEEDDGRNE